MRAGSRVRDSPPSSTARTKRKWDPGWSSDGWNVAPVVWGRARRHARVVRAAWPRPHRRRSSHPPTREADRLALEDLERFSGRFGRMSPGAVIRRAPDLENRPRIPRAHGEMHDVLHRTEPRPFSSPGEATGALAKTYRASRSGTDSGCP